MAPVDAREDTRMLFPVFTLVVKLSIAATLSTGTLSTDVMRVSVMSYRMPAPRRTPPDSETPLLYTTVEPSFRWAFTGLVTTTSVPGFIVLNLTPFQIHTHSAAEIATLPNNAPKRIRFRGASNSEPPILRTPHSIV